MKMNETIKKIHNLSDRIFFYCIHIRYLGKRKKKCYIRKENRISLNIL